MSDFARQQAEFQRGILTGDDTVLVEILDSPREKRDTLFGVYRYAYGSRLVEAMRNDHELLHLYLGDEMFDEMGHAYVKARPSGHPNLRWFSQGLPEFLKSTAPYAEHPVLSDLAALEKTLNDAFTSDFNGLKVIIAEGECQLERQRRIKPWIASLLKKGERVVRVKYGVDEDVCNGDHACIRLSGCPTLSLKDNPDPLKLDPVATVLDGCVGCGLCGENAHAATLCPSFYRAEVVQNPGWGERLVDALRRPVMRWLQAA